MKSLSVLVLVFVITACSQSAAPVKNEAAVINTAVVSSEDLAKGKSLYQENCAGCHELKSPEAFTETELKRIVPKMAKNAKVDASAETFILNYMVATTTAQSR